MNRVSLQTQSHAAIFRLGVAVLVVCFTAEAVRAAEPPASLTFESDILPILGASCQSCHGGITKKNGLDLRSRVAMLKGGKSGPAVVPGDPNRSPLWKKIAADEMPKESEKLSAHEKATIRAWIAAGAPELPRETPDLNPGKPGVPADVAAAIDRAIDKRLLERKVRTSEPVDDATILRRMTLDLTGRVPTTDQAIRFLDSKDVDKRAKWIDELLAAPAFGQHVGTIWHNLLVPLDNNKRVVDPVFANWLADGFNSGHGWDKTVAAVLTATGTARKDPAVSFTLTNPDSKEMAVKSARVFMGVRLDCAECHDHPHRRWSQENYWGTVAFFSRTLTEGRTKTVEETAEPNGSSAKRTLAQLPPRGAIKIPMDAATNVGKVVKPRLLDDTVPELGPAPPYRPILAAWVTSRGNPYFARAAANRAWAQCFGRGLVEPVDDLDESRQPVHPEVLSLLAREFVASGYDFKHLFRCICQTHAYQRSSRPLPNDDTAVALFARMPMKVMTPEVLLDSISVAAGEPVFAIPSTRPEPVVAGDPKKKSGDPYEAALGKANAALRPRVSAINQLITPPGADATDYRLGVMQALRVMNGPPFDGNPALAARLAKEEADPVRMIERLYLRSLSRRPTPEEARRMADFVARQKDRGVGYVGVLWVLVNSAEFVTNH